MLRSEEAFTYMDMEDRSLKIKERNHSKIALIDTVLSSFYTSHPLIIPGIVSFFLSID